MNPLLEQKFWRSKVKSIVLGVGLMLLVFWLYVENRSCGKEDLNLFTVDSACLRELQQRVKEGNINSQWYYVKYLEMHGKNNEADKLFDTASSRVKDGVDLFGLELFMKENDARFNFDNVEKIMRRVAKISPDAHLSPLQFYINKRNSTPYLEQAENEIPQLTQCADIALSQFLSIAEEKNFEISSVTALAIQKIFFYANKICTVPICRMTVNLCPK